MPGTERGGGAQLRGIVKGIKGVSARRINEARNSRGRIWQQDYFDRIIRHESELLEKLNYMLNNPAKNGLAEEGWDYPWWYFNQNVELP